MTHDEEPCGIGPCGPQGHQETRLGGAVRNAWGEVVSAHKAMAARCAETRRLGGDPLELHGDDTVRLVCALAIWETVVEAGTQTGRWEQSLRRAQQLAEEIMVRPLQPGLIGAAVGQVRAIAMQSVLTRMDEILTAHGFGPPATIELHP